MGINVKVAKGLLDRLGVSYTAKDSARRIGRKVSRAVEQKGEPHDLTGEERDLLLVLEGKKPDDASPIPEDEEKVASSPQEKAAKKEKAKKEKKGSGDRGKTVKAFVSSFTGSSISRVKLIEKASAAAGCPPATISNYISWAKQVWKPNPFGFHLKEAKNDSGEKILTKFSDGKGKGKREPKSKKS